MIFWVAAVFLLPVSPIWPPRRPFLPYGRPNLALAGLLVKNVVSVCVVWVHRYFKMGSGKVGNPANIELRQIIKVISQCIKISPFKLLSA